MHYIPISTLPTTTNPLTTTGGVVPLILLLFFSVILLVQMHEFDYTKITHSVIRDGSPVVKNYTVGNSSVIRDARKHDSDYTKIKTE
jgi:hypothetical protein